MSSDTPRSSRCSFSPSACPGQFFILRVERCHQCLFLFPRFFVPLNGQKSQPLNDWLSVTGRGEMLSKTGHCFYGNRSWLWWVGMSGFLVGRWPYWTHNHWYPSSRLSCSAEEIISTRSFLSPQVPGVHLSRILISCLPMIFDPASPVPAYLLFHHSHRENSLVLDFWGTSQCLWKRWTWGVVSGPSSICHSLLHTLESHFPAWMDSWKFSHHPPSFPSSCTSQIHPDCMDSQFPCMLNSLQNIAPLGWPCPRSELPVWLRTSLSKCQGPCHGRKACIVCSLCLNILPACPSHLCFPITSSGVHAGHPT